MRALAKRRAAAPSETILVAPSPTLLPELAVAQWPKTDAEWKRAIAFIQANLKGIMSICNQQAGPNAVDSMPYDKAVLFWYGHIADHLIKAKKIKRLEPAKDYIDV